MTKFEAARAEYSEAFLRFSEALAQPKDEFIRDSAIKRFEFTFDLAWKTIKAYLEEKGVFCASPAACFREAYRQGLVPYDEVWVKEIIDTRKKTVHSYDENLAEEVFVALPDLLRAFQTLLAALKEK